MKHAFCNLVLTAGALTLLLAPSAQAACVSGAGRVGFATSKLAPKIPSQGSNDDDSNSKGGGSSIVGLWQTTFIAGGIVWDEAYEQWHSDGTELQLDNAVPPALGNVCVGVYKQTGRRTYKLRHVAWNWDASGSTLAGTFVLVMTVTTAPDGETFTGKFVTDSFDNGGNVIPALHAEGTVSAKRITVD